MQLSTRARYAVRAVTELAVCYGQGPVLLKNIAKKQGISEKYLEQLLAPLRVSGLIYTRRGNKGGYLLGKDPRELSIYDVISQVEGSLAPAPCVDRQDYCERSSSCVTRRVWVDLNEKIMAELKATNFSRLAEQQASTDEKICHDDN